MTLTITSAMMGAAELYGRDYRRALDDHSSDPLRRMIAVDRIKLARRHLTNPMIAILDLVAGQQRALKDVPRLGGLSLERVEEIFLTACQKLAEHYEGVEQ